MSTACMNSSSGGNSSPHIQSATVVRISANANEQLKHARVIEVKADDHHAELGAAARCLSVGIIPTARTTTCPTTYAGAHLMANSYAVG